MLSCRNRNGLVSGPWSVVNKESEAVAMDLGQVTLAVLAGGRGGRVGGVERLGRGALVAMVSRAVEGMERVEPFPCVVRSGAREMIARRLGMGLRSVHALGEEEGVGVFSAPSSWSERVWTNLNCPEDLTA